MVLGCYQINTGVTVQHWHQVNGFLAADGHSDGRILGRFGLTSVKGAAQAQPRHGRITYTNNSVNAQIGAYTDCYNCSRHSEAGRTAWYVLPMRSTGMKWIGSLQQTGNLIPGVLGVLAAQLSRGRCISSAETCNNHIYERLRHHSHGGIYGLYNCSRRSEAGQRFEVVTTELSTARGNNNLYLHPSLFFLFVQPPLPILKTVRSLVEEQSFFFLD